MKSQIAIVCVATLCLWLMLSSCHSRRAEPPSAVNPSSQLLSYGGYPNQVAWGKHLVDISGCSDCHTPKKMTAMGPVPDTTMYLAGHPAVVPPPHINRVELEKNGLMLTNDLSVWVGPWGISYAANLTPDETGLGGWSESQFLTAIRKGKWKGLEQSRDLLPPMSFVAEGMNHGFSDQELKAIFAYLQTIRPVHNLVPAPVPPAGQMNRNP
ncbi:c-type cytochrome [Thermoflavifilum thermophilum]|uniref:Cytochrome c n=1 Tax=Thermoflavifilum thermophilum TaxID=1393122 RepID=A0A1I7NLS9_9BACT|nr:c-type cytochrome [Thermoflavifilum thermophilum]SFV35651.1 Cytochrome c [Thermoflavifilum thermophilum]